MQKVASDANKSKRQSFFSSCHYWSESLTSLVGDRLVRDVQSWLCPADPWKDHRIACELRHKGTAEWFTLGSTFSEWKASSPGHLLWIHGKRPLLRQHLCFCRD
jgi:hypothetical protein